jgi:Putative beta-barrel porin-2, OmpL-like. bbp2
MRSMKKDSITHLAILATIVAGLAFAGNPAQAQDTAAPAAAAPAADATPPSTTDLEKRIDELEKELTALKSQVAAPAPAAAAPASPAPAAAATSAPAPAAPAAPSIPGLLGPVTLSGFVDAYYGYNANQPANRTTALRNFDINSDQFSLNMIELIADKAPDPAASHVGFHVSLGFGQAMNLVNSTETGSPNAPTTPVGGPVVSNFDQYLKEGYLEYLIGKKLQINVGKFVTWNGAEVIESKDNWNYSRGLLFSWAIPYFHMGASAKYTFNSKFSLTGYLVNGWNNSVDNNSGKTGAFSAAWTPNAKWSLIQNYTVGPEHTNDNSNFRNLLDTIITYTPNAKLSLMANYDYGSDRFVLTNAAPFVLGTKAHWDGIAGYIKYAPNANWYIATRGEYFQDVGGFATGTSQNLGEFTLTLQRMLASKIMSRLEYRYDASNENVFPDNNGPDKGNQSTVTLGLIYAFSSADAPK